ncbi:MAG: TPM domain-containing protein, partial [Nitrosospira sp.]
EVGYGLEGVLPDAVAKRIIDEIIIPEFRQGDFAGGIDAGIARIIGVIEGEALPPPSGRGASAEVGIVLDNMIPLFIGLMVLGKILQSLFGRIVGATVMSTAAAFIGWLIFSSVVLALIIAVLTFLMSLFGGAGGGISRGGGGGWPGGFNGGRGRGGFGGGGFSGGGGGFGGGGASGRW